MSLLSDISYDDLLTLINWNPDKQLPRPLGPDEFPAKDRLAAISPPAGGKTTTFAGLFNRTIDKVYETLHTDRKVKARIIERASTLRDDVSNLTSGIFPAKTQFFLGFRSSPGLLLEEFRTGGVQIPFSARFFGRRDNLRPSFGLYHKAKQISFNDLPGETLSQVSWQYRMKSGFEQEQLKEVIGYAITEMRECNEFMFICNCAKARGLGEPIEQETDQNVSKDPDVSLARSFADIAEHKEKQGEHIKAVYVVLSAWDRLEPRAKKEHWDFDLFDRNLLKRQKTLEQFTAKLFRQFFAELHSHGIPESRINYYPTFFQTVKDKEGNEIKFEDTIEYMLPDGTFQLKKVKRPHIMTTEMLKQMDPSRAHDTTLGGANKISYSEETYDQLLSDILQSAPTVKT